MTATHEDLQRMVFQPCPNCGTLLNNLDEGYRVIDALMEHIHDPNCNEITVSIPDLGVNRWYCHGCRWVSDGYKVYMQIPEAS